MPTSHSSIASVLPACDLCHARKVKCDRRMPCANCKDMGMECKRIRDGRASRKRDRSSLNAEETVLDFGDGSPYTQSSRTPSGLHQATDVQERWKAPRLGVSHAHNRTNIETPPTTTPASATDTDGSNHPAIQARSILQLELGTSRSKGHERESILRSARQLVSGIADSHPAPDTITGNQSYSEHLPVAILDSPPPEMLYMALQCPSDSDDTRWPDHIPDNTYERMAAALLQDGAESQDEFHEYCVCVYVRAISQLYQTARTMKNDTIQLRLARSRSAYIAAAIRSIEEFNMLKSPSILTIQSLLSAAVLMQHIGRFNQCWVFTSYATRQIMSLNYHNIRQIPPASPIEQDIRCAVYWCYFFDSTFSALLCRPPSMPSIDVHPINLSKSATFTTYPAYHKMHRFIVELSLDQAMLNEMSRGENITSGTLFDTCQHLESDLQALLPRLQENRNSLPRLVQDDWAAVDFCYHALYVEVHRLHLNHSFESNRHRECVSHARKSLQAFHLLQQNFAGTEGFDDPYPTYLTWTILLYPLSAFFVIFCNIVDTSSRNDYELMGQITSRLSHFKRDPHLCKLVHLLQSLVHLCDPIFQTQPPTIPDTATLITSGSEAQIGGIATSFNDAEAIPFPDTTTSGSLYSEMMYGTGPMWEVFNSQVPGDWLDFGGGSFQN